MRYKKSDRLQVLENGIEEKFLNAALKVVSSKTISGTRMQLIADEAGMPKSNLHYYFKTKHNLMLALHKKVMQQFIDERTENFQKCREDLKDHLAIFFKQKLEVILFEPELDFVEIDFWLQANIEPEYKRNMSEAFILWRTEIGNMIEKYAPGLSSRKKTQLPCIIVSLLEGATLQYHLDSAHFDVGTYMDYCMDLVYKQLISD